MRLFCATLLATALSCKAPLLKRVDLPGQPQNPGEAVTLPFDHGMAGSPTNVWTVGPVGTSQELKTANHFNGTTWKTLDLPPVFGEANTAPALDIEALAGGDALLLSTRKTGGPIAGLFTSEGVYTDLTAALPGTTSVLRAQAGLFRRDEVVYALLGNAVFRYENATFTRLAPADEQAFLAVGRQGDSTQRMRVGGVVWELKSGTFYNVYPDDDSKVAKLEVTRSTNGGAPVRAVLKAAAGDLMGAGGEVYGCTGGECGTSTVITESFGPSGLVRGADGSVWVAVLHSDSSDVSNPIDELLFRKVVGDTITKEERFGIDLKACSTSKLQPECYLPRSIGGSWPDGSPPMFVSGLFNATGGISALLVPIGELR